MTFDIGDVVRLKSGGPKMTILKLMDDTISCQWFDRNGKVHTGNFQTAMLDAFIPKVREDS